MSTTELNESSPEGKEQEDAASRGSYRLEERAAGLFMLGLVLFSPLMLRVFDRGAEIALLGVPLLFVYVFFAWSLLIMLLAFTLETPFRVDGPVAPAEAEQAGPPEERV